MTGTVLFILTSHSELGSTGKPTGWYLEELAHPYAAFKAKGYDITLASPLGGPAPMDPASNLGDQNDAVSQAFLSSPEAKAETVKLADLTPAEIENFAALVFPGGHGPMWDLATHPTSQAIVTQMLALKKPVGAVCHGVAALVQLPEVLKGKHVTAFSDVEEEVIGLTQAMPFSLEQALGQSGAVFEKAAEPWHAHVCVDGLVVTGQNPASAEGMASAVLELLQ